MSTMRARFRTTDDVKAANREAGRHFFDPATMRFFNSRVHRAVYGGRYFVTSVTNRDFTVVMGTILLYAVFLVLANLFVDVVYAWLDPRIRLS